MKNSNLGRLIWKEWREGWPVLGAFFLFPAVVFPICKLWGQSDISQAIVMALLFGIPFTSVLWASEKRRMVKDGRDIMAAVLPVSPFEDWVASFILPSLAVTGLSTWLYFLYTYTEVPFIGDDWHAAIPACALAFMLCSFFSKTVSHFLGIMVGTFFVFLALIAAMDTRGTDTSLEAICWHRMYLWLPIAVAIASLLASELRKAGAKKLRVFAIVILPLYMLGMMYPLHRNYTGQIGLVQQMGYWRWSSPVVRTDRFSAWEPGGPEDESKTFAYRDRLRKEWTKHGWRSKEHHRQFPGRPGLVAMGEDGTAYMIDQGNGDPAASIVRWSVITQKTSRVKLHSGDGFAARMRSWYRMTFSSYQYWDFHNIGGWVDPQGTTLLVMSTSELGTGRDLGIVDLRTGDCRLLLADAAFPTDNVAWAKDRVFLAGRGPMLQIDTANLKVISFSERRERE